MRWVPQKGFKYAGISGSKIKIQRELGYSGTMNSNKSFQPAVISLRGLPAAELKH